MRKLLFLLFSLLILVAAIQSADAQTPSMASKPFANLEIWYGTQSTPAAKEKAIWGLDDINAYRTLMGLTTLDETVLDADRVVSRRAARLRANPLRLFR